MTLKRLLGLVNFVVIFGGLLLGGVALGAPTDTCVRWWPAIPPDLRPSWPCDDRYRVCPSLLEAPRELRVARTLKAGELRVSWQRVPTATLGPEPLFAETFVTVIVDDGETPIVRQVRPTTTEVLVDGVARGGDLEIAAAVTRHYHLLSEISRLRLRATQTRSWDRPRPDTGTTTVPPTGPPPTRPFTLLPAPQPNVAAGYNQAYWIDDDGNLNWIDDTIGRDMRLSITPARNVPPTGAFKTVGLGRRIACAVRQSDDTIACWGINASWLPLTPPAELGAVSTLAVGGYHACAVRQTDHAALCWGSNSHFQRSPPDGEFHAVTGGWFHSCGLRPEGQVVCWGDNTYGQTDVPPDLGSVRAITSGNDHNCAIRADNTVTCWGFNDPLLLQVPPNLGPVTALSAGFAHTCALQESDARIVCWGYDNYGQISQVPAGAWQDLSVGLVHTCGRRQDGTVECWRLRDASAPAMKSLSTGANETCGLRQADGFLQCWGSLYAGDRGGKWSDGRGVTATVYKSFFNASTAHCGIRPDDTLDCWGHHTSGILTQIPANLGTVKAVSAYRDNACVIKTDDGLVCWGTNADGQATVPSGLGSVKAVDMGFHHACAIKADDNLACWGKDDQDQSTPPTELGTVKSVGVGDSHTCVIKSDDTVQCWGNNADSRSTVPDDLGTVKVLAVAQGSGYACVVKADDSAACWGGTPPGTLPTDLGTVSAFGAGPAHTCAIRKTDGTVTCWGNDIHGETAGPKYP